MTRCPDDMCTPGTNDAVDYSDSDTDESYNPVEGCNSESSVYDSDEESHQQASLPLDVAITNENAEEEHWNGVWYGTSDDYDDDSTDGDCLLETGDTEDAFSSDTDESDVYELEAMIPHATRSPLLARDSRTQSLYRRGCNMRLFANAVHASS
jgi:hypothetical protein